MQRRTLKLLDDIRDAAEFIIDRTRDRSLAEYQADRVLSAAVERHFIIIGEAFNRLSRADPETASIIKSYPQIVGFRNVVVHGYDTLEDAIVWGIIRNELPRLSAQVKQLLDQPDQGA